ncbi:MAG: hypothetical protein H7Z14_06760, partial [Anaerolineae bacterium]|nr:hypothetical protein [Phycisphaerae bacterium]
LQRPALLAAAAGIVLMLVWLTFSPAQFFRGYLVAWLFVLGISLGSLAIVMLSHLTGGEWSWLVRRLGEAAANNLIVCAILFIPLAFGLKYLYPWADPELVRTTPILHHKSLWSNTPWFLIRALIYFAIWITLAFTMRRLSLEHDRTGDNMPLARAQRVSAAGLLLFVITMTLASIDWIMSRDAHWFSTVIGLLTVVGQATTGMAFLVFMLMRIAGRDPIVPMLERKHMIDLGNLLFTVVILWAYLSFSQFLIIWMGNTKEDVNFYAERGMGVVPNGWRWLALFLIIFHFFVPFFILLSRDSKMRTRILMTVAGLLLIMRWLDIVWTIVPTGDKRFTGVELAATAALGGIWLATFVRQLESVPLLPRHAPLAPAGSHDHAHGHGHAPVKGNLIGG